MWLILCLLAPLAAQQDELVAKSQRAKQHMAAGRFADAIPLYEELVKAVPNNPGLILNLGMAQHMTGRDREAIAQFERVLKLQPDILPALMLLGASYLRIGEPAKAVLPLKKGVALAPKDKQGTQMLVDALLMLSRFEEASGHLEKLVRIDPADPKTWHGLGRSYEALAQQAFEELKRTAPESGYTIGLVADAQLKLRRNTSAFALYREALAKTPSLRGAHAGVAQVYRNLGHADWAAVEDDKERKLDAPNCNLKPYECHFTSGRYREAAASAKAKKTPEALFWQVRAYNELATRAFARLEQLPPSRELHEIKAEIYRNQGRHVDSVREWELALKLSPNDPHLQREWVTSVYLSRDYPRVEPLVRALLEHDPNSAELHFFLGDTLLSQQKVEEAIPSLRKAVELDPKLLPARATLGRALVQSNNAAEAVPHLEAALVLDDDGSLHYQLSRAYQSAGQPEKGRTMLEKYQELSRAAQSLREDVRQPITPP